MLQLEEQGKLHSEDAVIQYLPFFKMQYPSERCKPITIGHLLNHSSGMPDAGYQIIRWIHHEGEPHWNQTEFLKKVLPDYARLKFSPGEDASYSNVGYIVLSAIIETVTGQHYQDYVRQNILNPLGMKQTDFVYTQKMEPFEAAGSHPLFDKATPFLPLTAGSFLREVKGNNVWLKRVYNDQAAPSGLIGSVSDAARLIMAYLNGGALNGQRILSEQSILKMTYNHYAEEKNVKHLTRHRRGIGWEIYDNDRLILQHKGGGIGFNTMMQIHPENKFGFVLFSNNTGGNAWNIAQWVAAYDW